MPLLEGDLQSIFGAAFGWAFVDATLHKATVTDDTSDAGYNVSTAVHPLKVQVDMLTDADRIAAGPSSAEAKIIVLQAGSEIIPATEDEITINDGRRYSVTMVEEDPAQAAWIVRARRVL